MLLDGGFKLDARKQLQQLTILDSWWKPRCGDLVPGRTHLTVTELSPLPLNQSGDTLWKPVETEELQSNQKCDI